MISTWGLQESVYNRKIVNLFFLHLMTLFVTFTFDIEERNKLSDSLGVARRPILWSFAFPMSTMGGTQVDDLLDVESQKCFTAIAILAYLTSL